MPLTLTGHLSAIGKLTDYGASGIGWKPCLQIRLRDGRVITIAGLTEEECREAAPMFLDGVVLSIERGPK